MRFRHATAMPFHDQQARSASSNRGESEALNKQRRAAKGLKDGCIMPHRHDFKKCFERTSADLAQVGRCNPHPYLLGEQFDQHHDAALAIGHLVDAFDTGKRRFG